MGIIGRRRLLLVTGALVGVGLGLAGPTIVADLLARAPSGLGVLGVGVVLLFVAVGIVDVVGIMAGRRTVQDPSRPGPGGDG